MIDGTLLEVGSRVYRVRVNGAVREVEERMVRTVEMVTAGEALP